MLMWTGIAERTILAAAETDDEIVRSRAANRDEVLGDVEVVPQVVQHHGRGDQRPGTQDQGEQGKRQLVFGCLEGRRPLDDHHAEKARPSLRPR